MTAPLYIVRFQARPTERVEPEMREAAGAIVVCYIAAGTFFGAIETARAAIEQAGWATIEPEYAERWSADEVAQHPEMEPYVTQALRDGATYIYHCYLRDEEEKS